jgi:hypothetical protein
MLPYALNHAQELAKWDLSSFLSKNDRNFLPVEDISTFKRLNHSILRAQHGARCLKRRNEPNISQNAIIRRF